MIREVGHRLDFGSKLSRIVTGKMVSKQEKMVRIEVDVDDSTCQTLSAPARYSQPEVTSGGQLESVEVRENNVQSII